MNTKDNNCPTIIQPQGRRRGPGQPRKPGRSVKVTVRLREGEHDEILARLARVPPGGRSAYIRRVLEGAPLEVLEAAVEETPLVAARLDEMWGWDDNEDDE